MYKEAFERLPERFRKPNNKNLYYIGYGSTTDLLEAAEGVRDSRDIDKAFGQTLDYLGANVGQYRTDEDDELFRLLIKTKIVANLSKGDIPTINEVAKVLFGDTFISVEESWDKDEWNNEPAGLIFELEPKFENLPSEVVDRTIAGGVGIKWSISHKPKDPSLYLGGLFQSGEEITIYPSIAKDLETNPSIYIGLSYEGIAETIELSNFKEPDDLSVKLDVRNIGNLINQLEQVVLYSKGGGEDV